MVAATVIPARFLAMMAHFVIALILWWSRGENIKATLPDAYTQHEYDNRDNEMIIALSLTMACFAVEFLGLFRGISLFNASSNMLYIAAHAGAAVALSFFVLDVWEYDTYWYIFGFCSAFPAVIEGLTFFAVYGLKAVD
eukprot:Opistho-1_new@65620